MTTGTAVVGGTVAGITGITGAAVGVTPAVGTVVTGVVVTGIVATGIVATGADGTICTAVSGGNAVLCAVPPQPMAATRPNIADVDMPAVRTFHA